MTSTGKTFAIIHDLGNLSNEERLQYLRNASAYFGLDPDLNALDTIWMNSEDGMRKLVAYARKGTTDLLRDIHGIEVSSLVQTDGPYTGCVSFMATGKNKAGRQEIAVGAHSTEGLRGQRLADAVMTAQTRALRRLTLQFVGGGLLDVSEVGSQTTDIGSSAASLAQLSGSAAVLPPPQAASPAAEPTILNHKANAAIIEATQALAKTEPVVKGTDIPVSAVTAGKTEVSPEQLAEFKAQQDKLRADARVQLAAKAPATPEPFSTFPTFSETALALPPDSPLVRAAEASVQTPAPEPKKRTRKKRNTVDLASPGQEAVPPATANAEGGASGNVAGHNPPLTAPAPVQTEMPMAHLDAKGNLTPVSANADIPPKSANADTVVGVGENTLTLLTVREAVAQLKSAQIKPTGGTPEAPAFTPTDIAKAITPPPAISPEKQKEYRERLSKYSQDILPKAGMMPSDGIGGVTMKLRKFAAVFTGQAASNPLLSEAEWIDLFEFLDGYTQKNGAPALVQYIDKAIGATK